MCLYRVFRISFLSLFLCLLSSVAASQVVEDILVIGQSSTFDIFWDAGSNSLSSNSGMSNRTPANTPGEYMARLRARQQCESQVGRLAYKHCEEKVVQIYDASINSCNVGAVAGAGLGALALGAGGVMAGGGVALAFAGPVGWVVLVAGAVAVGYGTHQMTVCRDHAARDRTDNLSACSSFAGAKTVQTCGSIMSY